MKLSDAIVAYRAIQSILYSPEGKDRVLPFKFRYNLTRIAEVFEKEVAEYEKERSRLVREYGDVVPGDETGRIEVTDADKLKIFYEALQEILLTEIEEKQYKRITEQELLDALDNMEIEISDAHMRMLLAYVVENPDGTESEQPAEA